MTSLKNILLSIFVLTVLSALSITKSFSQKINWKKVNALVYTKNGKGYVHANIPDAIACIQKLGTQHGFTVEASDTGTVFTDENLKKYSFIIFASTNNDVFDNDEQRLAFRRYIESGGGFVGIHSVVGTERNWKWFKNMVGGTFSWHPKFQRYRIVTIDPDHSSVSGLPRIWEKEDECYFQKEMYPGIHTLMAHDLTSLNNNEREKITAQAGPYTELYPAVWHQQFDGGPIWITALGHDKKDYEDPLFIQHIFNGIRFIAGQAKPGRKTVYAKTKDDPIQ